MWLALLFACPSEPPTAVDYCEETVDLFCDFHQRCDRSAAPDLATCQSRFLETCNHVYEPWYASLEARGQLQLDPDAIAACRTWLAEAPCEQQVSELQGPCRDLWDGLVPAGGACGLGIDSFVCADGSTCVLDLTLCGTCTPVAADGAACGDGVTCDPESDCVDGLCVARALPGEACSDSQPCLLGTWCDAGTCRARDIVGAGEACDQTHRCAYDLACVGGSCAPQAFLGEACGAAGCASGACVDGVCVALGDEGAPCGGPQECIGGVCDAGVCVGPPTVCVRDE